MVDLKNSIEATSKDYFVVCGDGGAKYNLIGQKKMCSFIAVNVLFVFLTNLLFVIEPFTHVPHSVVSIVLKIIIALFFVSLIPYCVKNIRIDMFLSIVLFILFLLLNYAFFPELNEFQIKTFSEFFLLCLPCFIVAGLITDYKLLQHKIIQITWLICVFLVILLAAFFSQLINIFDVGRYYMGLGYSLLIPACTCVVDYVLNKRRIDILCFFICCFVILLMGSRGPFLGISIFLFFVLLYETKTFVFIQRKIVISGLFRKIGGSIFLFSLISLFVYLFDFASLNSRTVNLLLAGEMQSHYSGRDLIQEQLWTILFNDFLTVRGINAEYLVIKGYAHNIVLELLFQFGFLVGGVIIGLILTKAIKSLCFFDGSEKAYMITMYMVCALSLLMVSSSLWNQMFFWIWIAMSFNLKNVLRGKNERNPIEYCCSDKK